MYLNMEALLHRYSASAWTYCDGCCAQVHHKMDILYIGVCHIILGQHAEYFLFLNSSTLRQYIILACQTDELHILACQTGDQLCLFCLTGEATITDTCAVGATTCHSKANCVDYQSGGFCCLCQRGYYGNGLNCLKEGINFTFYSIINRKY